MGKRVAVVLSGCGFLDGSEITEAVSALIVLSELGCEVSCFAPDREYPAAKYVGEGSLAPRNALEESGRIARRKVSPLSTLNEKDFDALVFPGGTGAAANLSTWSTAGASASVLTEARKAIVNFHRAAKPIGAICIAPALVARVLGEEHIEVTLGNDSSAAAEVEKTGAAHTRCSVDDYVSDRDHKILSTPAYMYDDAKPHEVFAGIRRMLTELVEMA